MDDITSNILRIIPSLLVWVVGLVLSIKMLRRGGTKPEKLLVAGCSMILIKTILSPLPRVVAYVWVNSEDMGAVALARILGILSVPGAIISLAGFICLVMAFWIKFKVRKTGVT